MGVFGLGRRPRLRSSSPTRGRVGANALAASGYRVRRGTADSTQRLVQAWQARSFSYYEMLGEIHYAAQFYARMLSPLRLYAAELDDDGEVVETTNPDAIDALERIQDPGGGRSGLLGAYGRLMFLVGEAQLFVTEDPDTKVEQWEMLSSDELRYQSGGYQRIKAPQLLAEEYREPSDDDWDPVAGTAVAYRLWQRHPRYSMLADSTMRGVLDICEELVLLTQAVRSRARSRLAGPGILFIDDRISPAPPEPSPDEDPQEDVFLSNLIEAMTTPIVDEGSAAAVVPLLVRVPVPTEQAGMTVGDMVKHVQIIDPTQLYPETGLRYELIKRLAIGLDMPPEILMGLQDSNHWTAWQIDEQTWKSHGQPKAQQLVDDLTSSFFRPLLRQEGVPNWERFQIAYDAAAIVTHPDRTKDAQNLYDRVAIGKKALRDASGFSEDDAPDEAERAERIGILTRDASLAWYGMPSPRSGGVETSPGVIANADNPVGGAEGGSSVEPGPPTTSTAPETLPGNVVGGAHRNGDAAVAARVLGAADLALFRAREAAGNRLRSLAKRDPASLALLEDVRSGQVAVVLGQERVRALGANERDLVAGAAGLIVDALRVWGIEDDDLVARVAENVEKHAARTLYEERPAPLPSSFTNYLSGFVAAGAEPG